MPLAPVQLGTRSNQGRFGYDGDARLINCYAEPIGREGKVPYPIYASDGFASFATTTGQGGMRAALELNGFLYVVGSVVSRVDTTGTATELGGIASHGLVTMARNRRSVPQIAIVCDGAFYVVENNVLTQVADADLPSPTSVTHLDGYFVFQIPDGRMFSSGIDNYTVDGLDFATAEANPDGGVRIFTRGRDLISFGSKSTEFWQNTGGENFPFSRTTSIDVGCLAPGSVASVLLKSGGVSDAVGFVGTSNDGAYAGVMLMQGYAPQKISTPQCDRDILAEADPTQVVGYSWQQGSHSFYAVAGDNFTWVYDAATGLPHERRSYGLNRWRPSVAVAFAGSTIFGDYASPKLFRSSSTAYDEAGKPIVMEVHTPPVHAYPSPLLYNRVFVDVLPGQGLNSSGDELDPLIAISYSEDGGGTWSNERLCAIGRQGDRTRRVVENRWGKSGEDGRTWRFRMSAGVVKGLTGCAMDVEKLLP